MKRRPHHIHLPTRSVKPKNQISDSTCGNWCKHVRALDCGSETGFFMIFCIILGDRESLVPPLQLECKDLALQLVDNGDRALHRFTIDLLLAFQTFYSVPFALLATAVCRYSTANTAFILQVKYFTGCFRAARNFLRIHRVAATSQIACEVSACKLILVVKAHGEYHALELQ